MRDRIDWGFAFVTFAYLFSMFFFMIITPIFISNLVFVGLVYGIVLTLLFMSGVRLFRNSQPQNPTGGEDE